MGASLPISRLWSPEPPGPRWRIMTFNTHARRFDVPALIDLVEPDGSLRRAVGLHRDPDKQALLDEYQRRYPADLKRSHPLVQVAETGISLLYSPIPNAAVEAIIQDAEHRALYDALMPRSALVVPLTGRYSTR